MADRAAKRQRRLVSTTDDDSDDHRSSAPTASSSRPRRGTAHAATIQRSSPEETRQSIHLTVKSSPNKLRQATAAPMGEANLSSRNIVSGKRASRSSRIVREVDSDDEEDEDAEEADAMDLDDDDEDEDEDDDAEGSDDDDLDAEGDDDDMDDATPARTVVPRSAIPAKPTINVTKVQDSVEAKELGLSDDDDDELSDPDSDLDDDEDAEGEDEDAEGEDDDELARDIGEDVDMDSDGDDMSRDQTPDPNKLTRRQRAIATEEQTTEGSLLALSNEAQKKKHLTAEEHAMRRAEMARRRKNLSEKRNEEEKLDTINRLLKKQPPKRPRRAEIGEAGQDEEPEPERASPLYVRYIQNAKGTTLGVPDEWLSAPAGRVLSREMRKAGEGVKMPLGRMVVEVE